METEEKKTPKKYGAPKQVFYFNEEGKLVVESNKGIISDGERYVKMYGDFVCNAKTMGEIIHQLRGVTVEIGTEEKIVIVHNVAKDVWGINDEHTIEQYCIVGASQKRIEDYEKALAEKKYTNEKIDAINGSRERCLERVSRLESSIRNFNKMPWWKRAFKKIDLK